MALIVAIIARKRRQRKAVDHQVFECSTSSTTESISDSPNDDATAPPPTSGMTNNRQSQRAPKPNATENSKLSIIGRVLSNGSRRSRSSNADKVAGGPKSMFGITASRESSSNVRNGSKSRSGRTLAAASNSHAPQTTPWSDSTVRRSLADPVPGLGPERPQSSPPSASNVYIPQKLHREPRGWAPASHNVPAPVKRTWGRAKAKMIAEQKNKPAKQ